MLSTSFASFYITGVRIFRVSAERIYLWVVMIRGCLTSGGMSVIWETPYKKGSFLLLSSILLNMVSVRTCYVPSWYAIIAISLGPLPFIGIEF